jgi:hypothetical protein
MELSLIDWEFRAENRSALNGNQDLSEFNESLTVSRSRGRLSISVNPFNGLFQSLDQVTSDGWVNVYLVSTIGVDVALQVIGEGFELILDCLEVKNAEVLIEPGGLLSSISVTNGSRHGMGLSINIDSNGCLLVLLADLKLLLGGLSWLGILLHFGVCALKISSVVSSSLNGGSDILFNWDLLLLNPLLLEFGRF